MAFNIIGRPGAGKAQLFENLRKNIGVAGSAVFSKKQQQEKAKEQLSSQAKMAILKSILGGKGTLPGLDSESLGIEGLPDLTQYIPQEGLETETITPYSLDDIVQAQKILGYTPEELYKDKEKRRFATRSGGFGPFGGTYGYSPEMEQIRAAAQDVVSGEGKKTIKRKGKFSGQSRQSVQQAQQEMDIENMRPQHVPAEDWEAASLEEKIDLLKSLGML